jgi:hypothetical protein
VQEFEKDMAAEREAYNEYLGNKWNKEEDSPDEFVEPKENCFRRRGRA